MNGRLTVTKFSQPSAQECFGIGTVRARRNRRRDILSTSVHTITCVANETTSVLGQQNACSCGAATDRPTLHPHEPHRIRAKATVADTATPSRD